MMKRLKNFFPTSLRLRNGVLVGDFDVFLLLDDVRGEFANAKGYRYDLEYQFIKGASSKASQYYRLATNHCMAIISLAIPSGVRLYFKPTKLKAKQSFLPYSHRCMHQIKFYILAKIFHSELWARIF